MWLPLAENISLRVACTIGPWNNGVGVPVMPRKPIVQAARMDILPKRERQGTQETYNKNWKGAVAVQFNARQVGLALAAGCWLVR